MFKNLISKITIFLATIVYVVFFYFLNRYNILPLRYRFILLGIILFIILIFSSLIFRRKGTGRPLKAFFIFLLFLISAVEALFMSYASTSIQTVEKINQKKSDNRVKMSLVVMKESPIETLNDLEDVQVAIAKTMDSKNINEALKKYKNQTDEDLNVEDFGDYLNLGQSLINGNTQAILLNENFRQMLDETIGFSDQTRVIKTFSVKGDNKINENKEVKKGDSFNVYISGIDTYGDLSTVSRSDVNLIVSVNPKIGKILITTIPRDTYVNIAGLGDYANDKLTHAGLFGVETSIKTLENLLDIDIDYYAKVNFSTLTQLIDLLNGIEVDNPVAFQSTHGNYSFPQGRVHMDGDMALSYSRERYHLAEGDFDRGKNQVRVMTGIIRKLLSTETLLNFNSIAEVALDSVNTNMPYDKMIEMVNGQIDNPKDWKIKSQSVIGEGEPGLPSYLMPGSNLYMMRADEDSLEQVHDKILQNNSNK